MCTLGEKYLFFRRMKSMCTLGEMHVYFRRNACVL